MIFLFVNEAAGPSTARQANKRLIQEARRRIREAHEDCIVRHTQSESDIENLAIEAWRFAMLSGLSELKIVLASGDTTIHQLVNALISHASGEEVSRHPLDVKMALVPLGSANALANGLGFVKGKGPSDDAKLGSVDSMLTSKKPSTLTVFRCTLGNGDKAVQTFYGTVVASMALHAHLLKLADTMRNEYPGPERFTRAAERIMASGAPSYDFSLDLSPGEVQHWDAKGRKWIEWAGDRMIRGPFAYFLATTCAELEPGFCIAPHASPSLPTLDLVILRLPPAESALTQDLAGLPAFIMHVFAEAWKGGKHLDVVWPGTEEPAVLYLRATSFKLVPAGVTPHHEGEANNRLFCIDGNVVDVPMDGHVQVQVEAQDSPLSFWAYH